MPAIVEYRFTLNIAILVEVSEYVEDNFRRTGPCRFMRNEKDSFALRLGGFSGLV